MSPVPGRPAPRRDGGRAGLGALGERLAAAHLERQGYAILDRNFRWRFGEIDLIARRGDRLAFVEVRTRRGDAYGDPLETLTDHKLARLRATVDHYCQAHEIAAPDRRIDVIAVRLDRSGRLIGIEHIEDAVEAEP